LVEGAEVENEYPDESRYVNDLQLKLLRYIVSRWDEWTDCMEKADEEAADEMSLLRKHMKALGAWPE
jgi:hypothetical protein